MLKNLRDLRLSFVFLASLESVLLEACAILRKMEDARVENLCWQVLHTNWAIWGRDAARPLCIHGVELLKA